MEKKYKCILITLQILIVLLIAGSIALTFLVHYGFVFTALEGLLSIDYCYYNVYKGIKLTL